MAVFTLDGKEYKVGVTKIDREFELVEGDNTMMAKTGREIRDVRGTAYRFTVHIDMRIIAPEEYDALYWALSAPVDYHDVTFPFGQSTLSFRAAVIVVTILPIMVVYPFVQKNLVSGVMIGAIKG